VTLGQRCDLAPAVRRIRTPQQVKGDRLNQSETGNLPRKAPRGAQRDRTAVGVPDQMSGFTRTIQQSFDDAKFGIRPERRISRPGRTAPIAQKVWGEDTIVLAEMVHDERPGAARSGTAVQQYDRLSGSCLAIEAVAIFCLQAVVCHC